MDLSNFHITLINGEKIFQSEDSHFGIMNRDGHFRGTTSSSDSLLGEHYPAICICSVKGEGKSIERIIPKSSILSIDKNKELLTRKILTEKTIKNGRK